MDQTRLGCEPRNFLEPCLLLLLREKEDHGYGLVKRLRPLNAVDGNAGRVYRLLRSLEDEALISSDWLPSESGPNRRVYRLTPAGAHRLDDWAKALEHNRRSLDVYLNRHAAARARAPIGTYPPIAEPVPSRVTAARQHVARQAADPARHPVMPRRAGSPALASAQAS